LVKQAERSAGTIGAIESAARKLFASRGFAETSIDEIAARAGVAKGAVYHHFASKEAIFARLVDALQAELAAELAAAPPRRGGAPVDRFADAVLRYLLAASEPARKRILLIDGPAVIGWQAWREIDAKYFGAGTRLAVAALLGADPAPRAVEALAHLVLGAVMEAALVCATADDPRRSARDFSAGLRQLLGGLEG
jgi:AcrR family transcriptional regulator